MKQSQINCKTDGTCVGAGETCANDFECKDQTRCNYETYLCEPFDDHYNCNVSDDCLPTNSTGRLCEFFPRLGDHCAAPVNSFN